ncbi:hypothetical protein [Tenacibaculum sp. 47A_GOM-205m]|uniref:hypothetical protein n=1 Tax=Tenacibaculum sp. 47A_GOM-205m TaxID=1380384 RepID=UPI00048E0AEA|nr:hypothetical protein [Tenacibaculum sp. 47A_GOM-205m]
MKNSSLILISLIILLSQTSCERKKDSKINFKDFNISLSKDEEPPLIFELKSENETQYFVENQPKKWNGLTKESEATIRVYDWKLFPHNNLEFEYPRTYSFEADLSITNDIWTLSGNDFKIMVIRPIVEMKLEEYVDEMISQFGKSNCSTKKITKKINSSELNGIKLSVTLAGIDLELDVLEVMDKSGKKSLLVFQDSLTDSKENSKESKSTMERMKQTFKIN